MEHKNRVFMLANQTDEAMMSFVAETEDGKVIVLDGGTAGDAEHLLEVLKEIGGGKPAVDAWFLTHPHLDHTGAFIRVVEAHMDEVEIRRVYWNFPSRQFLAKNDSGIRATHIDRFYEILPKIAHLLETVSQGDVYEIGAARFEVLYTTDPAFVRSAYNDSSLVLRMELGGQSFMFLADLDVEGGRKLLSMHGGALKSDFVEISHHARPGAEKDVYEAIAPLACFWCTPQWVWDTPEQSALTRAMIDSLSIPHHFNMKDGDVVFELPYPLD